MSRSEQSLPEPEIRVLLADDPPAKLSTTQRHRLRERLGLMQEADPGAAPSLDVVAAHQDISVAPPRRSHRGRRPAWLAAAAAVIVAGLLVLTIGNRTDDSGEIQIADSQQAAFPTAAPTPEPAAATVCREHVGPFTAAIATWDGIDNWVFLTDKRLPEPDLATLAFDAIAAIESIATLERAAEATRMLTELRANVATGAQAEDPFDWTTLEREAHRDAVVTALAEITNVIDREQWAIHEGCG